MLTTNLIHVFLPFNPATKYVVLCQRDCSKGWLWHKRAVQRPYCHSWKTWSVECCVFWMLSQSEKSYEHLSGTVEYFNTYCLVVKFACMCYLAILMINIILLFIHYCLKFIGIVIDEQF